MHDSQKVATQERKAWEDGQQRKIHLQVAPRKLPTRDAIRSLYLISFVLISDLLHRALVRCQIWEGLDQRFLRELAPFLSLWRTCVKPNLAFIPVYTLIKLPAMPISKISQYLPVSPYFPYLGLANLVSNQMGPTVVQISWTLLQRVVQKVPKSTYPTWRSILQSNIQIAVLKGCDLK